jgi:serine/threonine protein kinase
MSPSRSTLDAMGSDPTEALLAGKYQLIEQAGSGGMAVVWRARTVGAAGFSRPVAVKRVLPQLARDPEFIAMFVEEARVVSELQHPLITQIHDFGVDEEGHHFLVMEWVEGVDLGQLAASFYQQHRRVPWPLAAAITIEVLGALGAAHARRGPKGEAAPVYHRDVTPQNILLSIDGYAKLTDFGIAKAMDRASMTRPNALKGKLSYIAPEQMHGKPASVQTDLFSVGVCLWETLAGRKLFEAPSDMQVIFLVEQARIPDLRIIRNDIPDALWEVVSTALARDPHARYDSTHAMARQLAALLRTTDEPTDTIRIAEVVQHARAWRAARREGRSGGGAKGLGDVDERTRG